MLHSSVWLEWLLVLVDITLDTDQCLQCLQDCGMLCRWDESGPEPAGDTQHDTGWSMVKHGDTSTIQQSDQHSTFNIHTQHFSLTHLVYKSVIKSVLQLSQKFKPTYCCLIKKRIIFLGHPVYSKNFHEECYPVDNKWYCLYWLKKLIKNTDNVAPPDTHLTPSAPVSLGLWSWVRIRKYSSHRLGRLHSSEIIEM